MAAAYDALRVNLPIAAIFCRCGHCEVVNSHCVFQIGQCVSVKPDHRNLLSQLPQCDRSISKVLNAQHPREKGGRIKRKICVSPNVKLSVWRKMVPHDGEGDLKNETAAERLSGEVEIDFQKFENRCANGRNAHDAIEKGRIA